ncbi:MAG: rhomboid family intramembrane serine protease [Planctomycetota bacterium]|nr:rhomboid family intramembrane serine protease [Planctomycetota bacterium]
MQILGDPAQPATEPQRVQLVVGRGTWATWLLIGLNLAAFGWMLTRGADAMSVSGQMAYDLGANQYHAIRLDGEWWRLVVSTFLHGGLLHLFFNMWGLRVLGPFAEAYLGGAGFLTLYLICGVAASVTSIAWNPEVVSLGASGAIFGLLGATLAFFVRHRREMPKELFRGQLRSILMLIAINVALGLTIPQVDNAAHFGGLLFGFLGGFLVDRPLLVEPRMTVRRWIGAAAMVVLIVPFLFVVTMTSALVHGWG